jgi:hypothetical protein
MPSTMYIGPFLISLHIGKAKVKKTLSDLRKILDIGINLRYERSRLRR